MHPGSVPLGEDAGSSGRATTGAPAAPTVRRVPVLSPGDHAPAIEVPACTPGRRNARLTGPGGHRGRWVVLGFLPREERAGPAVLRTLADLGAAFTFTGPAGAVRRVVAQLARDEAA